MSEFSMTDILRVVGVEQKSSRGRKKCGKCKKYVGVRTRMCSCGYDFKQAKIDKAKPILEPDYADSLAIAARYQFEGQARVIYVPCGKCPYKFDNMENWVENVVRSGFSGERELGDRVIYSRSALTYWLRIDNADKVDELNEFLGEKVSN